MAIAAALGLEEPRTELTVVTAEVVGVGEETALCRLRDPVAATTGPAVLPLIDYGPDPTAAGPRRPAVGRRIQALIVEPGSPPVLSATRTDLVAALLPGFVPEIREGAVRVMRVAWKPGARVKIAVASCVPGVDPVAACLGRRANRVLALSQALGGDKVEIIPWSANRASVLLNAMAPVRATGVLISERNAVVSVAAHQMSAAVGKGGLNSELAGRIADLFVHVVEDGEDLQEAMAAHLAEQNPPPGTDPQPSAITPARPPDVPATAGDLPSQEAVA